MTDAPYTCIKCKSPANATRNPQRVTLPAWHVECTNPECEPRNVAEVDLLVENGISFA